jgi:hypothetical protein
VSVLKPEMLVDVTFLAPKVADDAAIASEVLKLYLPQQLIQQGEGGSFVWIADVSDKVARRMPVTTGSVATGGLVEVSGNGLTVASRVISRGFDDLNDGDRIRIVSEEAPSPPADSYQTAPPSDHGA